MDYQKELKEKIFSHWRVETGASLSFTWNGPHQVKTCLRAAMAQISIREVQSGSSLSANRITGYHRMYEWRVTARMIFAHAQDDLNLHTFRFMQPKWSHIYLLIFYHMFSSRLRVKKECRYSLTNALATFWISYFRLYIKISAHVYARGRKQCCKLHYCLWRVSIKTETHIFYL